MVSPFSMGVVGGGSLGKALLMQYWKTYYFKHVVSTRTPESKQMFKLWMQKEAPMRVLENRDIFVESIHVTNENKEVAQTSQVLICVKPTQAEEACESLRGHLNKDTVVISAMAAVPLEHIQDWLNHELVARIMPTVVNDAPICVYNPNHHRLILPHENTILFDNEESFDGTVGVCGCMPGLMSYVLDKWIDAIVDMGYSDKIAEKLVLDNFSAIARSNPATANDLTRLLSDVSSPRGATETGVEILRNHRLDTIFTKMFIGIEERLDEIMSEK